MWVFPGKWSHGRREGEFDKRLHQKAARRGSQGGLVHMRRTNDPPSDVEIA